MFDKVHIKYSDLLYEYVNDSISESDKIAVEQWLEESAENKAFFNKIKDSWENNLPDMDIDETKALKQVYQKAEQINILPVENPSRKSISLRIFTRIAAILIICLGAAYLFNITAIKKPLIEITSVDQVINNHLLPDESVIHLNKNTSVSYPETFDNNTREVTLKKGSIFCEVKHQENEPLFLIQTARTKVQVVGTKFSVDQQKNKDVSVFVEDGVVAFYKTNDQKNQVLLQKGETALYDAEEDKIRVLKNDNPNIISWHTGILYFEDTPLTDVVEYLNSMYHANINIRGEKIKEFRLSAKFDNKTQEEILFYIEQIFNISVIEENGDSFLTFERNTLTEIQ